MKKRISILLVVTMLVSMFCTFSIASAEGETAKPEVLIYGGSQFDGTEYGIQHFANYDADYTTVNTSSHIVIAVAMKGIDDLSLAGIALKYDPSVLIPQKTTTMSTPPFSKSHSDLTIGVDDWAYGAQYTGKNAVTTAGAAATLGKTSIISQEGLLIGNFNCTTGFKPATGEEEEYLPLYSMVFKVVGGEAAITAETLQIATLEEAIAAGSSADMPGSLYYRSAVDNGDRTVAAGTLDYTININNTVLATSKASAPATEAPATEAPATEAPKSSNVALDSFGVSGIAEPTLGEGIYEVEVETSAYVYIWARPADAKATVKSAIVDSKAAVAGAEFDGGKTAELKLATGETKYVAFEITAEDGVTKEVYTVKLYREESSNVALDSFGVAGIAEPTEVDGIYQAEVTTAAWVYIWARPADAKATVKSAVVASEDAVATADFNGGKTAELKVGTGETKYVAFEITAQNGATETYIVKLYREASSDVRINSFGTSGIDAPVAVDNQDYDYEVTINTSSYSYIWARPEYAQATVRSAVADSIDAAKAALADGKTVQIDRMTEIDDVKYVAFEITAQNGDKATYIVKVTRQ